MVFYGDVGTGKTHLACALVAQACQAGIPARFSPPPPGCASTPGERRGQA
ncbi:ATP-binding protein [Corynebacterium suedekumii]|nr:ATP-binding protein [Corynebacterium suedekumii]